MDLRTKIEEQERGTSLLSISIFYDRRRWHSLILNWVIPFIKKNKEVESHVLSLSGNHGDHVNLFLVTSESKVEQLAGKIEKYFGEISLANRTIKNNNPIPKYGIFRDFEPNTVHYGLYDLQFNSIPFNQELSKLLIRVFQKHREETILSLTEIMIEFFALFNDFSRIEKKEVIDIFEKLLQNEYKQYNAHTLTKVQGVIETNFDNNKEEVISFLKSRLWQNNTLEPYQEQWRTIVEQYQRTNIGNNIYLITELCNFFDFEDRMGAYYLYVNALKMLEVNV